MTTFSLRVALEKGPEKQRLYPRLHSGYMTGADFQAIAVSPISHHPSPDFTSVTSVKVECRPTL